MIPFQIFNALYPIFISIGTGFGIPAVAVIAPFVCNLSLATSSTPTNSSTYTGCALTETEVQHYCRKAVPIQTVTNAVVVLTAVISGCCSCSIEEYQKYIEKVQKGSSACA